jgi:adenylate cyclase
MVMREGLSKYDGYEIITEGDSFHIAFTNVYSAVGFCLDVQSRLMDINWDTRILKLDECKMVTGGFGQRQPAGMEDDWRTAGVVAE